MGRWTLDAGRLGMSSPPFFGCNTTWRSILSRTIEMQLQNATVLVTNY